MKSVANYADGNNIILRNRQLNFSNLTAIVNDSRVTEDTLILVYYSEATQSIAQAAGISAETNAGNITFTASTAPTGAVVCDIVLLSANTVNLIADASNVDYSNTTSGLSATDVQDAIDEVAADKAAKSDIAPEFENATRRLENSFCYHDGILYQFLSYMTPDQGWDLSKVTPVSSIGGGDALKIMFSTTLGQDVLTAAKGMAINSIRFYANSNKPTNRPSNNDWGAYMFINSGGSVSILSWSSAGFACTYGITSSTQSITWKTFS